MFAMNPNLRGTVGEMTIALEATRLGVEVFKPLSEHSRCDLIFGIGDRLLRVQCKSARLSGQVLQINLVSSWHTPTGYVRNKYLPSEVDLVAAHCHELDRNYLIPFDRVEEGKSGIHLRLTPPQERAEGVDTLCVRVRTLWGCSSAGRASAWHAEGHGFESRQLHSLYRRVWVGDHRRSP